MLTAFDRDLITNLNLEMKNLVLHYHRHHRRKRNNLLLEKKLKVTKTTKKI